jgi:phosphomannomutase
MVINPEIFNNYDIRAVIPDQLDMEGIHRISEAVAYFFKPQTVALGYDARNTSGKIFNIFVETFLQAGIDVDNLGMVSTDMMNFASGEFGYDLAIMITASHNPPEYNGFKISTKGGIAVSGESGFFKIRELALSGKELKLYSENNGRLKKVNLYKDWIKKCFSFIDLNKIDKLKVVIDAGNGVGGELFGNQYLVENLPIEIIPLYFKPDGRFPNHQPNPLKKENLIDLTKKVKQTKADWGAALDGDGDRIGFVTKDGKFVSGTVITALLAEKLLENNPGEIILYNAVCGRIVSEIVEKSDGVSKRVKVGHSLIKQVMRRENALFAGEHSCHYFYRDVYTSEASLLTFLLVAEYVSTQKGDFRKIVEKFDKYPQTGEINFEVDDKREVMKKVEDFYQEKALSTDWLDGLSVWFENWWFNLRPSNTQPLLRLNLEADNQQILADKKEEVISLVISLGAVQSSK